MVFTTYHHVWTLALSRKATSTSFLWSDPAGYEPTLQIEGKHHYAAVAVNNLQIKITHFYSIFSLGCPLYRTSFNDRDIGIEYNIDTWLSCSKICRDNEKCMFWSWGEPNSGKASKRCYLKETGVDRERRENIISGKRICGKIQLSMDLSSFLFYSF